MNRREFSFGAMAMAMQATAPKYRIIDAQVHVWINDAHYPWAPEIKKTSHGRSHARDVS
jgi:predicted TIM-barrel fold metal-dependent hydrolase